MLQSVNSDEQHRFQDTRTIVKYVMYEGGNSNADVEVHVDAPYIFRNASKVLYRIYLKILKKI